MKNWILEEEIFPNPAAISSLTTGNFGYPGALFLFVMSACYSLSTVVSKSDLATSPCLTGANPLEQVDIAIFLGQFASG